MCDTVGGIRFCGCRCQSENPLVCFSVKPTKRASARGLQRDRKRTRKGRSKWVVGRREQWREGHSQLKRTVGRGEQSRECQSRDESRAEKRPVSWRGQSAEGSRREQSAGESSQEKVSQEIRVEQRKDQSTEDKKAAARICWPTDAGLTNARRWVSIPRGFVEVSRKYTPTIACKCTESCTKSQRLPHSWDWS